MSSSVRRTLRCIRSGPVDLYMLRWFSFSRKYSCLKLNVSSVLPTYLGSCGILFSCSWVNTELKNVLRVLAMSSSVATIWTVGVLSGPTLSLTILLSLMLEYKPLGLVLHNLATLICKKARKLASLLF